MCPEHETVAGMTAEPIHLVCSQSIEAGGEPGRTVPEVVALMLGITPSGRDPSLMGIGSTAMAIEDPGHPPPAGSLMLRAAGSRRTGVVCKWRCLRQARVCPVCPKLTFARLRS